MTPKPKLATFQDIPHSFLLRLPAQAKVPLSFTSKTMKYVLPVSNSDLETAELANEHIKWEKRVVESTYTFVKYANCTIAVLEGRFPEGKFQIVLCLDAENGKLYHAQLQIMYPVNILLVSIGNLMTLELLDENSAVVVNLMMQNGNVISDQPFMDHCADIMVSCLKGVYTKFDNERPFPYDRTSLTVVKKAIKRYKVSITTPPVAPRVVQNVRDVRARAVLARDKRIRDIAYSSNGVLDRQQATSALQKGTLSKKIKSVRENTLNALNKVSESPPAIGGEKGKKKYNGREYVIRTGKRGGKYILVNKEKIYI